MCLHLSCTAPLLIPSLPQQDVDDQIHLKGGLVAASSPPLMIATATMLAEGYNVALVNVLASRAPGEQG